MNAPWEHVSFRPVTDKVDGDEMAVLVVVNWIFFYRHINVFFSYKKYIKGTVGQSYSVG